MALVQRSPSTTFIKIIYVKLYSYNHSDTCSNPLSFHVEFMYHIVYFKYKLL